MKLKALKTFEYGNLKFRKNREYEVIRFFYAERDKINVLEVLYSKNVCSSKSGKWRCSPVYNICQFLPDTQDLTDYFDKELLVMILLRGPHRYKDL